MISGNAGDGVVINSAGANGNVVIGNYIGTNATGNADLGNSQNGVHIRISASGNTVGGTTAAERNVISGNNQNGVLILSTAGSNNVVRGNYIGTDAAGTGAIANSASGVEVQAATNTIGGTAAGAGNVISGNTQYGVFLNGATATGNIVQQNLIGTRADGTTPLGNQFQGVGIFNASNNLVGGQLEVDPTAGNVIANNGFDGVSVSGTGTGNRILGNSIRANTGNGIDVVDNGPNVPQDVGDGDTGANNLQNFPVLAGAGISGGQVTITGTLNSTASRTFRLEFFANTAGDGSGYGEGQRYLGYADVTTDGTGNVTFSVTLAAAVAAGEIVSATATDLTTGDTSEFAANVTAALARTISGTVYDDVDGDAAVSGGEGTFAAATVKLYLDDGDGVIDAGDALVATTATNGAGAYAFLGVANGTYYVVVDSKTLAASASAWAEQTYAVTGAAIGAGFTVADGALYGGRAAGTSDNAAALTTAEHVTKVTVAGADRTNIDSGFSFSAIVNTRGDTTDDDAANARLQQGSLRQFILNSNALAGTQTSNFSIGSGTQTITLSGSVLPDITDAIVLDATTQEGVAGVPAILLDGSDLADHGFHLTATADGSTIRAFVIRDFNGDGIRIDAGSDGNVVAGNYIGRFNVDGTVAAAGEGNSQHGVRVLGADNTIGGTGGAATRNVISGNSNYGVFITGVAATGNLVEGNYIGTDVAGAADVGNGGEGARIESGASNNTIGGAAAGAGNVISGNDGDGIEIQGTGTSGNTVAGNIIGLNAAGTTALANTFNGILIALGADGNVIGGTAAGARNVISGNTTNGVRIDGAGSSGNIVEGNYIGTDVTGALDRGNSGDGVRIANGATANTIGGSAAGAGNVISGNNTEGIRITDAATANNVVEGNLIGRNAADTASLGNSNDGINIQNGAFDNTIGGTTPGEGNVISANENGVQITGASTGNAILGNSIYGNTSTGIELNNDGVNPPNGTTNPVAPNIDMDTVGAMTAALGGTTLTLSGYVGNMPSSATFANARVEFFVSDNDPTGWGEGRTYLGFLTADANSQFSGTLNVGALVNVGDRITATATDAAGNTSEFSLNVTVVGARSIAGTVYHDVNADAAVSGAEGVFGGATVHLYLDDGDGSIDAGDTFVASTTTDGAGAYSFTSLAASRYWVVVDSKTLTLAPAGFNNFATGADDVWAEETYAAYGARTGLAGFTGASGAFYGGRYAGVSDDGSLLNGEHVIGRDLSAVSATNVDYGFSFNAVVNNRGDAADDDGVGGTDRLQQGTLRQFLLNANALAGVQTSEFEIGAAGSQQTITPTAALPTITDAVVLDAWTQGATGYSGPPLVVIDGNGAVGATGLLRLSAGSSTVRGFVIQGSTSDGIRIDTAGGNTIVGNYIGTNAAGTAADANGSHGIWIAAGANGNTIGGTTAAERNVIGANGNNNLNLSSNANVVLGNYVGIGADGATALGATSNNIYVTGSNNTIGGTAAGARNVISTSSASGVFITTGTGNVVQGNYIGTDATGVLDRGNAVRGVEVWSANGNTIGGAAAGAGNLVSGQRLRRHQRQLEQQHDGPGERGRPRRHRGGGARERPERHPHQQREQHHRRCGRRQRGLGELPGRGVPHRRGRDRQRPPRQPHRHRRRRHARARQRRRQRGRRRLGRRRRDQRHHRRHRRRRGQHGLEQLRARHHALGRHRRAGPGQHDHRELRPHSGCRCRTPARACTSTARRA